MRLLQTLGSLHEAIESGLSQVLRWKYAVNGSNARPQSTLAHSYAILTTASLIGEAELRHNPEFNHDSLIFVLKMALLHDVGELECVEQGYDHVLGAKKPGDTRAEIDRFLEETKDIPIPYQDWNFRIPYLAQYIGRPDTLTEKEEVLVREARGERLDLELKLFRAIHGYEALLYAYNEFQTRGNIRILVRVMRTTHEDCKRLASELPGFGQETYSWQLIYSLEDMANMYQGVPLKDIPDRHPEPSSTPSPLDEVPEKA